MSIPSKVISSGDTKQLQRMIDEEHVDVNEGDEDGWTPLHLACMYGHDARVRLLVEAGADVNKGDENGWTPLHRACGMGREVCVRVLVENGADVNKVDENGETPLHDACNNSDDACVRVLVENGADVNKGNYDGGTPLLWACSNGHDACARLLVKAGADVNKGDINGNTPLHNACWWGHEACVQLLLLAGARCDGVSIDGGSSAERLVVVVANPFVRALWMPRPPTREEQDITWRCPSLCEVRWPCDKVERPDDLPERAVAPGDRVRVLETDGVWRVARVVGHQVDVERAGAEPRTGVPMRSVVLAGAALVAWDAVNAAAQRGCRSGAVRLFAGANALTAAMRRRVEAFL